MNRRRIGFVLVNTLFAVAATGLSAWAFWNVYQSTAFIVMLAVTLGVGAIVAVGGALARWPSIDRKSVV